MDESAIKDELYLRESDETRICVSGYDIMLGEDDLKRALGRLFSSCGVVTRIDIVYKIYAYIHLLGEGIEEKALKLSGSDVGGFKITVWTFPKENSSGVSSMDESAIKDVVYLREGDEFIMRRICVSGYDIRLGEDDVKRALSRLFSSCGVVTRIDIVNKMYAYIHLLGEGTEEKALKLSGSDVGGFKITVSTFPREDGEVSATSFWASMRETSCFTLISVTGYDNSLPNYVIEWALAQHFRSCGRIDRVILESYRALISLVGEDAEEKALQLSGSDMGGFKIVVQPCLIPKRDRVIPCMWYGYNIYA